MIKKILPLLVLVSGFAHAQVAENIPEAKTSKTAQFGMKGGLNLANLKSDSDTNIKAGVHAGFFVEIKLDDKFSIQPELLFSMQGAKSEYPFELDGTVYDVEETVKLAYLNVPVMAKFYATREFSILAGPQAGFLVGAKDKVKVTYQGESNTQTVDAKDYVQSVDFGLNFGIGYDFSDKVGVEARYNLGLSNIFKVEEDGEGNNRVIQFSLSYKF